MKKLLSIMLTILMVVTMLPMAVMPASAAENESDGVIYCDLGPWAGSLTALKLRYSSDNSTINDIVMEEVDYNIWKADLSTNNPAGWIVQFLGYNQSAELSSEGTTIPEGKNCFRITEYNSSSGMYDGVWYQYPCTSHEYKDGICACGEVCLHEDYTAGKCNACGYECPHEGQNGSCEVCGANLGKLVIDVTDKSYVDIGTGYEYYDEDGYIITGTNPDTYVYIYESADLTLMNATFPYLVTQYAPEDSVINITLEGANEVAGFIGFMKEHLIFNGSEGATLKTPYIYTNGGNGTATVNGGNIILDLVTEYNIPTIECNGGFTINGGTVTASDNNYYVVYGSVTLNGGELNIISTSTDYEAITGSIIIEKGALLTVSATKGILDVDSDIVMADDAEENDYFFVRYDTESEFVPVQDIEAALNGKTYAEIKIDTHEHDLDNNGKCVCGYECPHESFTDSKCDACGYICTHEGQNGSCQVCGANLGELVIDVTDEQYVHIGSGQEYYDEDGYIITGNNPAVEITVFEGGNYTLDGVTAKTIVDRAGDDTVNITIKGNNVFTGSYNFSKADFIIDAVDGATLKALYVTTGGKDGTLTVNGGDIVLDYVTESYSHTIACNGGFIINGGTVTASNNFSHVVYNAVTLNGGELNVISTSADYAAIEETVTMKKGALLTVSAASGMLGYDSEAGYIGKIVMADDAEENDYFFVRYDTESEFVPVQDINSALDGKTYAEIKIDTHEHSYTDGICDCGYVCLHVNFADGICPDCTASGKLVAIKMSDSNNDGWYGKNAVVIKQLVDGAFEEVETATLTDGKSGTVAVNLDKDGIYVITWQSDYFSFECGFEIYVDGECVYSISDADGIENNAILYTICEHTGGKADCLHRAVCEKCGNEYGEVDADGHIMEDNWSWHSSEQHMRGCAICHASASYEYEDHYGGSATCDTLAICEGCGQSYGEYAADVHLNMSDWKPYSTEQHHRYCLDCGYGTEYADHVEPDNIEDIPCTEDAFCKECGEKISSGYKHGPFEWKPYDSYQHQYVCDGCGGVTDYEPHNFIDSVCDTCGYECSHESYTDGVCDVCNYLCPHSFTEFTETVAPKCEEPGWEESYCDYCSIKLEQEIPALDHDWVSGGIERPYQNIDGSWTDGYYYDTCKNDGTHINITGVAKRADYSAYDEAYKSLKAAQKNANLTDAGAAAVNQAVMTGMTMPQNIVEGESTTAYLNNWVKNAQSILAKIENGEYLKADYTEIDEAIASVDTALENASISDEMTEELEDIKADLEALKENENATMADVNALLDRTEAIAETMNNCANGVHSFTKYEEVTAPKCGVAGKEAAICDNGCGVTDEKEIPALTHKDADGDYKCDYGCGHEFEKPAEPEDPSANCDHLCHSNNWFVKNIIWKIVRFFWKLFKMNPVCECGEAHY